VPAEGTKGVTIDAAATGEPERSCIITSQPFLSFLPFSFSRPTVEVPTHPLPAAAAEDDEEEEALCPPTLQSSHKETTTTTASERDHTSKLH
jgi:hypothetical protein